MNKFPFQKCRNRLKVRTSLLRNKSNYSMTLCKFILLQRYAWAQTGHTPKKVIWLSILR